MKRTTLILPLILLLAACSPAGSAAEATLPPAGATHPPADATSSAGQPVFFYYFIENPTPPYPEGSIVILADSLVLAPEAAGMSGSADPAADLRAALEAALQDGHNPWIGGSLYIDSLTLSDGFAEVALKGVIAAPGDVVLIAARWQILLTVFANANVQTALVTLEGDNIGNLGISHSSEGKTPDYAYNRAEVEAFKAENTYAPRVLPPYGFLKVA